MASNVWVAGPTEIHVGVGSSGGMRFLGWALGGVRVSLRPHWADVHVDLSGQMPFDCQFMGEEAFITAELTAWDEAVLTACQTRTGPSTGTAGMMPAGSMGALMVSESAAFRLLCYPPYAGGNAVGKLTQAGQVPAYNFLRAILAGPDDIAPLGIRPKQVRAFFRALPLYSPVDGSFTLYNRDSTGKPLAA
jgi:hypothetical protein